MEKVRKIADTVTHKVSLIGVIGLLVQMVLTTVDIILKMFTTARIPGSSELVEFIMVVVMFIMGFAMTQMDEGHVRVDMFVNKFPPKGRCIVNGIIEAIVTIFSGILAVKAFQMVGTYIGNGSHTSVLLIPYWLIELLIAIGFVCLTLTFLLRTVEFFAETKNAKPIESL